MGPSAASSCFVQVLRCQSPGSAYPPINVLPELDHPPRSRIRLHPYLAFYPPSHPPNHSRHPSHPRTPPKPKANETPFVLSDQIRSAYAALHARHIIHNDVEPRHILLAKTGVKIIDFDRATDQLPWKEMPISPPNLA